MNSFPRFQYQANEFLFFNYLNIRFGRNIWRFEMTVIQTLWIVLLFYKRVQVHNWAPSFYLFIFCYLCHCLFCCCVLGLFFLCTASYFHTITFCFRVVVSCLCGIFFCLCIIVSYLWTSVAYFHVVISYFWLILCAFVLLLLHLPLVLFKFNTFFLFFPFLKFEAFLGDNSQHFFMW